MFVQYLHHLFAETCKKEELYRILSTVLPYPHSTLFNKNTQFSIKNLRCYKGGKSIFITGITKPEYMDSLLSKEFTTCRATRWPLYTCLLFQHATKAILNRFPYSASSSPFPFSSQRKAAQLLEEHLQQPSFFPSALIAVSSSSYLSPTLKGDEVDKPSRIQDSNLIAFH